MKQTTTARKNGILLSMQMLCDEIDDLFWDYNVRLTTDKPVLTGCRIFYPEAALRPDIVYIVPAHLIDRFPVNEYNYISQASADGKAPHITELKQTTEAILDTCLSIFQRYHDFENDLNAIITGDGTLNELCLVGTRFFRNPLYIHDNMFSIIAIPKRVQGMLEFSVNKETGEMHIPLWLINDFKFDEDYQRTLTLRHASIWGHDQFPHPIRSLFVNLWEGEYYYGRLLINEIESSMKPGQFYLAEIFAEYCKMIIRRDNQRASSGYTDHEETLRSMVSGLPIHDSDLHALMDTLSWDSSHLFLCLKLISQSPHISVRSDSALRSQLATMFKGSVQFYHEQSLCVLFNLTLMNISTGQISTTVAPLIRDNYLYGGLSNPVRLIPDLKYGSLQADAALQYMKDQKTTAWMTVFSDCILNYIFEHISPQIPHKMLIPPVLYQLRSMDLEKGTTYYETLKTFICCERSIPKTSSALFIHRTTLLYRLEKLNEILKMDLDNEDVRLTLMLAFRLMDENNSPDFTWD